MIVYGPVYCWYGGQGVFACCCRLQAFAGCPAAVCMLAVPTATTWWLLGQLAAFILIPRHSWNKL
jgi:hypothetical protein